MAKKAAKSSGILSAQRPRRRKKYRARILKFTGIALLAVGVGAAGWYLRDPITHLVARVAQPPHDPIVWQVEFKASNVTRLDQNAGEHIRDFIASHAQSGSSRDLAELVEALKAKFPLGEVRIIRDDQNHLSTDAEVLTPYFAIESQPASYATKEGLVFTAEPLTHVDHLVRFKCPEFVGSGDVNVRHSGISLQQAIELLDLLNTNSISVDNIHCEAYRGFLLYLKESQIEVAIGLPPYADKMKRLKQILADLGKHGRQAARIELDYEGKAFIRQKNL